MTRRIDLIPNLRERTAVEALFRAQGWAQVAIDELGDSAVDDEALAAGLREVRAVLAAVDALAPQPRQAGPLNGADAQALRLDLGADAVVITAWMPGDGAVDIALAASGNRTLAQRCAAAPADALAAAVAAALPPLSAASAPEASA
ncbi:hypothetical protein MKK75_03225 [Methylobacterium sp. J-030]|uniref:hypothetical protein n=1 Tax=Methylobacterium sp. J-030 TaxID=2836627 RepID=UPI001FBA6075|nr:hypothetical protein [Methylobacterium sp. J-030]MCJ2067828.1 hypothetical protein [Methylobacterium sp. J-030]